MNYIRQILIPTDFSEEAHNSLEYGINLARATTEASGNPTKIVVLHSFQVPVTTVETTYVPDQAILMKEVQERAEEEMKAVEKKYLQSSGIPYELELLAGAVMDNINRLVKDKKIDLVLMATHKASKLDKIIGDLTVYALEKCKAPLLLIPETSKYQPIRRLAFATDLKKIIRADVFDKLRYLAQTFNAHIIVLNVNTDLKDLSEKEAEELKHIKMELQGMEYHFQFVEGEDAEKAILDFVHRQEVDIVAAVPRHHGFFEGLFHHSVSKNLALNTKIPLLAIHE